MSLYSNQMGAPGMDQNTGQAQVGYNPGPSPGMPGAPAPYHSNDPYNYGGVDHSNVVQFGGMNQYSPGAMDINTLNPEAAQFQHNNLAMMQMFGNSAAAGAFNPDFYKGMQDRDQRQLTTALGNQWASRGLAGSSAEMGGMNNAIQTNQMNWLNRQQSDQIRAMQAMTGLNSQAYQQTMGIQNQYQNWQSQMANQQMGVMGMNQQRDIADQQAWMSLLGAGIGAAGMAAGGMPPMPSGGGGGGGGGNYGGGGGNYNLGNNYEYPSYQGF